MANTPQEQFHPLYKSIALPLMKFIVKRMGGSQIEAEEVFSRTITAAFKGYKSFKHKSSFFTWICRIALNKMADYYREQIHEGSIFIAPTLDEIGEIATNEISASEKMALAELRRALHDCLNLLPPNKKRLLYLRYWELWSIKKISKYTGLSERAVEGQIYRGKQNLKFLLEAKNPELAEEYKKK